jgi:zinc protease
LRALAWAAPLAAALAAGPALGKPAPKAAVAPKVDIKSWKLANGLEVLFVADHKAPIATVQVFYHVGSKDEHVGIRGVAHMFEHMMFKGSERVPPEQHARLLKEVGGQVNAFTTEDITAYHDTVPPSYVGFAMELEAERMRHLKLFQGTIDSERKVVEEEKRLRVDNNPVGKAIERFRALAFTKHPYAWTPIGTIEDLEKVTPEDCQKFYDAYYQPNNATLVVVGDVDEAEVRKLAEQHFGAVPRGPAPPRNKVEEPAQTEARRDTLTLEVQVPIAVAGYHVPRAADPDAPALEVLAAVLATGESSRLHQRLVRKDKLAIAAGGLVQALEDSGLFLTYAAFLPVRQPAQVRQAIYDEIARARDKPISSEELEKAKNQLAASYIFGLQTVDGVATDLGEYQYVHGDWREFAKGAARYMAVTAADVTRVARKYLVDTNLIELTLQPAPSAGAGASAPAAAPTDAAKPKEAK